MARIVRLIEYLGTEEQLKSWMDVSCRDGVSPMFSPERRMTITTVESDIPDITPGKDRPLARYENSGRGNGMEEWLEENKAVGAALEYFMEYSPVPGYKQAALQRVLDRVNAVLAEQRSRT